MNVLKRAFSNARRKHIILLAIGIVLIVSISAFVMLGGGVLDNPSFRLFEVREMDLDIVVTEDGVLQAKESEKIIPDIDSEAKIIWVEDEGEYIQKGDRLVELDSSAIQSMLDRLELELITAKADWDIAKEEVKKYEEGEYKQKLKELDFAIEKAKAKLLKAQEDMPKESSIEIYSKSEIRDAKIAVDEANMNLEKAKLDRFIYEQYTDKKSRLEKKTEEETARQQYDSKLQQIADLKEQLRKMVLRAPREGLVIYGGEGGRSRWRGDEATIKVGALVYKGQVVITLPDLSSMQVLARVHEVEIHKVDEGQKVDVRIDAFPDMFLKGVVASKGAIAKDRDWRTRGVKVFDITIDIEGTHKQLRPGMSAQVEIQVERIKGALAIPIDAVFEEPEENEKYCFVSEGGAPTRRVIELGSSDDNFVVVKKGLKQGELVYQYDVSEELNP